MNILKRFLLKRYEFPYTNGKKNGIHKRYYENGGLEHETPFKDNMIHGTIKWFYENGSLLHTTDYIWGLEHGYVKNYSESGKLLNTPPLYTWGCICTKRIRNT